VEALAVETAGSEEMPVSPGLYAYLGHSYRVATDGAADAAVGAVVVTVVVGDTAAGAVVGAVVVTVVVGDDAAGAAVGAVVVTVVVGDAAAGAAVGAADAGGAHGAAVARPDTTGARASDRNIQRNFLKETTMRPPPFPRPYGSLMGLVGATISRYLYICNRRLLVNLRGISRGIFMRSF
jgi:hypothetical protein